MRFALVALLVCACGGKDKGASAPTIARELTKAERMIALLPNGCQMLVEIDLQRLRGNPVVGDVAKRALASLGAEQKIPGLPLAVQGSPLASADMIIVGSYALGTAQVGTVTIVATKEDIQNAVRLNNEFVVIGSDELVRQVEARAAIASRSRLEPSLDLMKLRDHAMPEQAPGATLRVTAQLSFDARVAIARQTGLDVAPAQISIWGDVVDDLVIVIDADAADPGDTKNKDAAKRLAKAINVLLAGFAREPAVRLIGLANNFGQARMIAKATWVRVIIEVGPRQLARVVERARALLPPS